MNIRLRTTAASLVLAFNTLVTCTGIVYAQPANPGTVSTPVVLSRDEAAAILPQNVFFHGQSASIQGRNSAGLRLADRKLVLLALVDTSGYSSAVQQTYQAYLLTEVPLTIAGQKLAPGAYGLGFIAGNKVVVMDIGANEILSGETKRDESLARPTPLQILPDKSGGFRLYLGRNYVSLAPAEK